MNFGTLILLFIIASIISGFSSKKKSQQLQRKQSQDRQRQGNVRSKGIASPAKNLTPIEIELVSKDEGSLYEDKKISGSLTYMEVDASDEGMQTEAVVDITQNKKDADRKTMEYGSISAGLSEMQYNIVMAEIVGLPRALKRNIR